MPYVNDSGPVTKVLRHPTEGFTKRLPENDGLVTAFRNRPIPNDFSAEDLFNKLVELGVISSGDRP